MSAELKARLLVIAVCLLVLFAIFGLPGWIGVFIVIPFAVISGLALIWIGGDAVAKGGKSQCSACGGTGKNRAPRVAGLEYDPSCPACRGSGVVDFSLPSGCAIACIGLAMIFVAPPMLWRTRNRVDLTVPARRADLSALKAAFEKLPAEQRAGMATYLLPQVAESEPGIPPQQVLQACTWLLEQGAVADAPGTLPALAYAAGMNADAVCNEPLCELLLKRGGSVAWKNADGDSILHLIAAHVQSAEGARRLLDAVSAAGAKVEATNMAGNTALHIACITKPVSPARVDVVKWLLAHGANPNLAADRFGRTPLLCLVASSANDPQASDVLELLFAHKADVNVKDVEGNTSLHYVVVVGTSPESRSLARKLLQKGAPFHAKNAAGKTALEHAAGYSEKDMFNLLQEWQRGGK